MEKAIDRTAGALGVITGVLFLVIFSVNVLNIAARYVFGISYIWIPDLSRILFIWMIFLGGAAAYINRQHLMIDLLRARLRGRALRANDGIISLGMAGLFVLLIVKGARITAARMNIPYDSWDIVPTAVAYVAVPVAGAIMLLATVSRLVADWKAPPGAAEPGSTSGPGCDQAAYTNRS